jgi:hypothetical protein
MGSPTWQTDTLETGSFMLNRLPVWTDQRREGFNAEVSYGMAGFAVKFVSVGELEGIHRLLTLSLC